MCEFLTFSLYMYVIYTYTVEPPNKGHFEDNIINSAVVSFVESPLRGSKRTRSIECQEV